MIRVNYVLSLDVGVIVPFFLFFFLGPCDSSLILLYLHRAYSSTL